MKNLTKSRLFTVILSVLVMFSMLTVFITRPAYAATSKKGMLKEAKKTPTDKNAKYVVVFSYSAYKVRVYKITGKDKKGREEIKCWNASGSKNKEKGHYKIKNIKTKKRISKAPKTGKKYYENFFVCFQGGERGFHSKVYDHKTDKVWDQTKTPAKDYGPYQRPKKVFSENKSEGCVRVENAGAKWIFNNCSKGDGVSLMS